MDLIGGERSTHNLGFLLGALAFALRFEMISENDQMINGDR